MPVAGIETLDWFVVGIYFSVVIAIAVWAIIKERRGGETSTDYFLAGRNIGWFVVGASLFRLQHRLGAPGRPGRYRCRERSRHGPARAAGVADPSAAGLGLRAVLHQERCLHHARVSRAALLAGRPLVSERGLGDRLCADQDLGDDLRRWRRLRVAHGDQLLDRGGGGRGHHRSLHDLRRSASGGLHRHAAGRRPDRRAGS